MTTKDRILLESKAWTKEKLSNDPGYLEQLKNLHNPSILWIACSDSLVPVHELINAEPGDVLVHTNMAVQIRGNDQSLLAVLEEAIHVDNIKHIVVCGYSNCSGIRHVIQGTDTTPALREWLKDLRALYERHRSELDTLPVHLQEKLLNELNIKEQVMNLSKLPLIQKAWEKTDYPKIFGWYFNLPAGSLQEVFSMETNHKLKQVSTLVEAGQV